jgi:hypothetical protein
LPRVASSPNSLNFCLLSKWNLAEAKPLMICKVKHKKKNKGKKEKEKAKPRTMASILFLNSNFIGNEKI